MSFLVSPPEIISSLLHSGTGSAPMLAASTAWDGLATELSSAVQSFSSITSGLAAEGWQGPASAAMLSTAAQYTQVLSAAATLGAVFPQYSVNALVDSGGVQGTIPTGLNATPGELISIYAPNDVLLYQYTYDGTYFPTPTPYAMNTGALPFIEHPAYINYSADTTTFYDA
jgi:PPE-repeat protein